MKRYNFSIYDDFTTSRMERSADILIEFIEFMDQFTRTNIP